MDPSILLQRAGLFSLTNVLPEIEMYYPAIGKIISATPIFEGYEDANFILATDNGKYVIKFFLQDRTEQNIHDYAKVIDEATNAGVQTMRLINGKNGAIGKYENASFIVTEFFTGQNFQKKTPTMEDIISVTQNIARLNTLQFPIEECYDSWGNKNLIKEFSSSPVKNAEILNEVKAVICLLTKIETSLFSKSVIHGDMQRKHVLFDGTRYCIIDYGCMSYDAKVYEISTHLAWFCLGTDNWENRDEIYSRVIAEYTKIHSLSEMELEAIKPYILAAYASYYLKTAELIEKGDSSNETIEWHNSAKKLFAHTKEWISV